jgi:hypothetical protein
LEEQHRLGITVFFSFFFSFFPVLLLRVPFAIIMLFALVCACDCIESSSCSYAPARLGDPEIRHCLLDFMMCRIAELAEIAQILEILEIRGTREIANMLNWQNWPNVLELHKFKKTQVPSTLRKKN